ALCKVYYPRYIWVNNVYNVADSAIQYNVIVYDSLNSVWMVDNQKLADLSNYLTTLKYSGIVVTHLEDVFKSADSTQLKNCMAQVVAVLHNAGVPIILNQFRTGEEAMQADSSKNLMLKLLSSSILYNQNVTALQRFDGLLLDYEFWGEDYALDVDFAQINDGFLYFNEIATEFTAAKANPNNHFKILAMWIGNTVFACDTCDFNGDGLFGDSTIHARPDDEALMNMFDSHGFDRIVLSFFLDDLLDSANTTKFDDPLTFLTRQASGNKINNFFARLYYLGENAYPTYVIPQFHSGKGNGTLSNTKLENYLNGTGPYWGPPYGSGAPHYLHEVEQTFVGQYFDPNIFDIQNINGNILIVNKNWGTTTIKSGFEWFRYQLGPLDYANLPA
ncbi:MAG TPA: hypothetical protein PLO59_10460, partial [Bacteroidia bacterium]|nr:hypothetical protein [Bacteroidia bacterium]